MEIKVYYNDTDAGGVVYYANYLRYFEIARTEYVSEKGVSIFDYHTRGIVFTVIKVEIEYRSPARYGDILAVSTKVEDVSGASFELSHIIRNKIDKRLIVEGRTRLACINDKGRPMRLPDNLKEILENEKGVYEQDS